MDFLVYIPIFFYLIGGIFKAKLFNTCSTLIKTLIMKTLLIKLNLVKPEKKAVKVTIEKTKRSSSTGEFGHFNRINMFL